MIPHSKPTLGIEESKAIIKVLSSGHITQGEQVKEFEQLFARFLGLNSAVAVNSGTSALHLALYALGIGKGDEVIIPSLVCTALLNAINYLGAKPVIADINAYDYNISFSDVKKRITKRTKAIIVPHIFGRPSYEFHRFLELEVPIIEDCAQSIGAKYEGANLGTLGDIGIYSFYATKVFTTGEGGMVVSKSKDLVNRIDDLREYDNKHDYEIRFNYKMSDLQAAIGLEQLRKLPEFICKRKDVAEKYNIAFNKLPFNFPQVFSHIEPIWYRYIVLYERVAELIRFFHEKNIFVSRPIFKPLHRYLYFSNEDYPVTEKVFKQLLSFPIYPSLKTSDREKIIGRTIQFFNK